MPSPDEVLKSLCVQSSVNPKSAKKDKTGSVRALNQIKNWLKDPEEPSEVIQVPGSGGVVRVILESMDGQIHGSHVDFVPDGCQTEFKLN